MRRKTSIPEIRENSHRSSYVHQTTVHHERDRMEIDEGSHREDKKVTSPRINSTSVHSCTHCGIDFPSLDSLKKHEFLDHSNWGDRDDEDHLDSPPPLESKAKWNHLPTPPAETNGTQLTSHSPKSNSEEQKKDISIFTCQLCGAAFFDKSSLDHHKDMHTKAMITPTTTAAAAAATATVKTNSSSSYITQQSTMKNCRYCGEGFMSQTALAQHEHAHELVTKDVGNHQVYKCRHCDQKFDRFCDMMQHERTHVGEDMFQWQLDGQEDGPKRARGRPPKAGRKPNWQLYAEIDQYLSDTMPSSPGSPRRGRRPKVRKYTKHNRPGSHIKRAKTAYFYFLEEFRKQYRTEAGWNCKASEITKACGTKWNSMGDEERKHYVEQAAIDRERYESEIAVYKKERDPEKPKKPPTAFFFFLTDFRAQMAGQKIETGRRLTEICGEQWNKLTEEQKSPYMNIYAAEVKKYQDAMEEYKSRKATASENLGAQWRGPGRPAVKDLPPYNMAPSPM